MTAAEIEAASNALSSLEPLASFGLAVCLAYVGLDPFRYKSKIEAAACERLSEFSPPSKEMEGADHYRWLQWIAGRGGESPGHKFGFIYGSLFKYHFDRVMVFSLVGISAIVLIVGVGLKVNQLTVLSFLGSPGWYPFCFWLLLLSLLLPLVLIIAGRLSMEWGVDRSRHFSKQIIQSFKVTMDDIRPPVQPLPAIEIHPPQPVAGPTRPAA